MTISGINDTDGADAEEFIINPENDEEGVEEESEEVSYYNLLKYKNNSIHDFLRYYLLNRKIIKFSSTTVVHTKE